MAGMLLSGTGRNISPTPTTTKTAQQIQAEQTALQQQQEQQRIQDQSAAQLAQMSANTGNTQAQTQAATGTTQYATTPSIQSMSGMNGNNAPITQQSYETQAQTKLQADLAAQQAQQSAQLQADAEARRISQLSAIQGSVLPTVSHGTSLAGDEAAARSAAFARAKDTAGQTAQASLKALTDVMANSGRMGSSMEASGISDIIGDAGGDINNFTRDELMMDLARAAEIADMEYQGGIAQRGQNLSQVPSLLGMISASGTAY